MMILLEYQMKCRNCNSELKHSFVDLGFAPPSNAYINQDRLDAVEKSYPLKVCVCDQCWLVQTQDYVAADDMFSADYAYFSSISSGWLRHAKDYTDTIIPKLSLTSGSHVIEIASNDGYLLKNFVAANIPCLGIEPTSETAQVSRDLGIPVLEQFFGLALGHQLTKQGKSADLVIGNNVLAHVPDINDFVAGLEAVLKPNGVITMEFPHLLQLIQHCQFDTIYHEHFSYLSLGVVQTIFDQAGLDVFDVEHLPTHGGSLRIYAAKKSAQHTISAAVKLTLQDETDAGLYSLNVYAEFQSRVDKIKNQLLMFLIEQKQANKTVIAYGAAAKGNTLLNYAGVKPDLLSAVCDAAPSKQGKRMPGSHIPIYSPEYLLDNRPDFLLILPWNIAEEVKQQNASLAQTGTQFVTAIPSLVMS